MFIYSNTKLLSSIYRLGNTFFSFETLFVLFLFAGQYKADQRFAWISIDLTALFFTLNVFTGLFILWRRNFRIPKNSFLLILISFIFVVYIISSFFWSPGYNYAMQKTFYIATLTWWSLIATSIIIANNRQRIYRFFRVFLLFTYWIALETFIAFNNLEETGFVTALGGNYLGISRILGFGSIILLVFWLSFSENTLKKLASFLVFIFFIFLLLVIGGRGPFLAVVLSMLVPWLLSIRIFQNDVFFIKRYIIHLSVIFVFLAGSASYLLVSGNLTTTLRRLLVFLEAGGGSSVSVRLNYYTNSVQFWLTNPLFGHGIGSWPVLMGIGDVRGYPHNLLLEVACELGILGLIIFSVLIIYAVGMLGSWNLIRKDPIRVIILMSFVYTFANALISGDIADNRMLFAIIGIMALPKPERNKKYA